MSKFRNKLMIYDILNTEGFYPTFTGLAWRAGICRKTLYNYMREDATFAYVCRSARQTAKLDALARFLNRKSGKST